MMRGIFWSLILANLVLLAFVGPWRTPDPAPAREQLSPERVTLLSRAALRAPGQPEACVEVGDFSSQAAERFESQLARVTLPSLPQKRQVVPPPSNLVFLPPQANEAAAQRRLAQVRELGFSDVAVIREPVERRFGLSLGLFTSLGLAEARLKALREAGVTDARIEEHPLHSARYAYQLRGLDPTALSTLREVQSAFAGTALRDCP